jgi:methyl-accepting chemotaxis protein
MQLRSIQTKIALIGGICLLATAGSLVGYGIFSASSTQKLVSSRASASAQEAAVNALQNLGGKYAGEIRSELEVALDSARAMADTFEVSKLSAEQNGSLILGRDQVNAILLNVLKGNPDFNGTYSCWEPNAIDGLDQNFTTGQNGNNAMTGRFTPYWTRSADGKIAVQPLVEYDTSDKHPNGVLKGGWYIGPRDTQKESVLGPLPYIVQGKQVWLATMSVPIIVDGKFMGVAGADYDLDFVQKISLQVDKELFGGKGEVAIISDQGLLVADSEHPDSIGEHFKKVMGNNWESGLKAIQAGNSLAGINEESGMVEVFAPIKLGRTGKPWSILLKVQKDIVLESVHKLEQDMGTESSKNTVWQLGVGVAISILAMAALWLSARSLAHPIRKAADLAKAIQEGDLSQRLSHAAVDEVGKLSNALDRMADSLQEQVHLAERISQGDLDVDVRLASDRDQLGLALQRMVKTLNALISDLQSGAGLISSNADQVSGLSQDLASGATESASAITEISATITQIAAQTRQSADNANRANHLSVEAEQSAQDGNKLMDDLMVAMQEIDRSGRDITNIIKAIDEIATQTNLLALNAAIEAARAGQHGRGFAVVADEVRNLAARSAEAAKRTASLIAESSQRTVKGMELADKTATALADIVTGAAEASALVADIASAASEQASGIEQISLGIGQIDEITHQNSASSEQCSAAASELTAQASQLNQLISKFKVKRSR